MNNSSIADFIYKRNETQDAVTICYNPLFHYFKIALGIVGIIGCLMNQFLIGVISLASLLFVNLISIKISAPIILEIEKANRQGKVTVAGKRFSFQSPRVITINLKSPKK